MSLAVRHLLILWMTLVSCRRMNTTRPPYVSEFEYHPRLHPSENPDCASRFTDSGRVRQEFEERDRPSMEIRATLVDCKKSHDERGRLSNCARKIVVNVRFNNVGKTDTGEKFVVIDHALDSMTTRRIPLSNPYVIKIRQETILQMYGLKFQGVVNAEAREEVINNQNPNFTGCNVDSDQPTCGQVFVYGRPAPLSRGFCCSCDPRGNEDHLSGGFNETSQSFCGQANSNCDDAASKPCNRSLLANGNAAPEKDAAAAGRIRLNEVPSEDSQRLSFADRTTPTGEETGNTPKQGTEDKGRRKFDESLELFDNEIPTFKSSDSKDRGRYFKKPEKLSSPSGSALEDSPNDETIPNTGRTSKKISENTEGSTFSRRKPNTTDHPGGENPGRTNDETGRIPRERANRQFHSVESTEARNASENAVPPGSSLIYESRRRPNSSPHASRSLSPKYAVPKKSRNIVNAIDNRKKHRERSNETSERDKNSSGTMRGRRNMLPSRDIDSRGNSASVHVSEPSKDFLARSNSDQFSSSRTARPVGGNSNRITGNRPSKDNEESRGNGDRRASSKTIDRGRRFASENPSSCGTQYGRVKNYSPQKRTLKDLSSKTFFNRDALGIGENCGDGRVQRSRRHLPSGSGRMSRGRRTQRGFRERRRKREDAGGPRRVYLDASRDLKPQVSGKKENDPGDEEDRRDNVDQQIEDKFSRISDALREDRLNLKGAEGGRRDDVTVAQEAAEVSGEPETAILNDGLPEGLYNGILESADIFSTVGVEDLPVYSVDNRLESVPLDLGTSMENIPNGNLDQVIGGQQESPINTWGDYSSSTSSFELPVSSAQEPSPLLGQPDEFPLDSPEDSVQSTGDVPLAPAAENNPVNLSCGGPGGPSGAGAAESTKAVIVVDLFKIPEDPQRTTVATFLGKLGGLKEDIANAFRRLKPGQGVQNVTERTTPLVTESTVSIGVTKVTDRTFRLEKTPGGARTTTPRAAVFHEEVAMEDSSIAEEKVTLSATTMGSSPCDASGRKASDRGGQKRKEKRTIPLKIVEATRLSLERKRDVPKDDSETRRSIVFRGNPSVKVSVEAGNLNLVEGQLGEENRFSREQKRFLRISVNNGEENGEDCGTSEEEPDDEGDDSPDEENETEDAPPSSVDMISHPWSATTKASNLIAQNDRTDLPANNRKTRNQVNRNKRSNLATGTARILPPCGRNGYRCGDGCRVKGTLCEPRNRGRRLLSVSRMKDAKSGRRKDRKKVQEGYAKEDNAVEEDRIGKRAKPLKKKEKSTKRDTGRTSLKRKKKKKNSREELLVPRDLSEDYDYTGPVQDTNREEDVLVREHADTDNNSEELLENYSLLQEDPLAKEGNTLQEGNSYNQLIDGSASADGLEKYSDQRSSEVLSVGSDAADNVQSRKDPVADRDPGKDYQISLTGKIHLESDSNGRPVSISFNGAPEYLPDAGSPENPQGDRLALGSTNPLADTSDSLAAPSPGARDPLPNDLDQKRNENPSESMDDPPDEYYHAIRARSRSAGKLKSDPDLGEDPRRLQKKSVESPTDSKHQKNLKRAKKSLRRTEQATFGGLVLPGADDSVRDDFRSVQGEVLVDDLPPDVANLDAAEPVAAPCFAVSGTTQKIETMETQQCPDCGAAVKVPPLSIHDLKENRSSVPGVSIGEKTEGNVEVTTTLNPRGDLRDFPGDRSKQTEPTISSPLVQVTKTVPDYSGESVDETNMLALSEFVKKLESLVQESGNQSNATGRTLIHLKKFVFVPDNRTLWSLKDYSAPGSLETLSSTETMVLLGDRGQDEKVSRGKSDRESEYFGNEGRRAGDADLIKEIVGSSIGPVVGDDHAKRDAPMENRDNARSPSSFGSRPKCNSTGDRSSVVDGGGPGAGDTQKGNPAVILMKKDLGNLRNDPDSQLLKSDLRKDSLDEDNNGVLRDEVKEKRETAKSDPRASVKKREDQDKDAKGHKRRKKWRWWKKKKKKKKKKKHRGKGGKKKSRLWPFKRNLLTLSEEDQLLNVDYEEASEVKVHPGRVRRGMSSRRELNGADDLVEEKQIRGGQDCSDRRHPRRVDLFRYLESAHCLRFSDLWYSVYQLEEPMIVHSVHMQLYLKRTLEDGSIAWRDLANGSMRLGTFNARHEDGSQMSLQYEHLNGAGTVASNLDPVRDRLLVPSTVNGKTLNYPEAEGWSREYLVVQADEINLAADECDKAGVGFAAFVGQPDRCKRARGTCLKNQPLDYWRRDVEARKSGTAGCYFLSNFARVPSEAIKYNVSGTGSREYLALEYHSPHVSVIDIELGDGHDAPPAAGSAGGIAEVRADNRGVDYTLITALITNEGSSTSSYGVRITDCPAGLPASWLSAESPPKTIPPHRHRKAAMKLPGRLSLIEFSCTAVLFNENGAPITKRSVIVRRHGVCDCARQCACSSGNETEEEQQPTSPEVYRKGGFTSSAPSETFDWTDVLALVALAPTVLLLSLLLLGFSKWTVGLCLPAVARWGLDELLVNNRITEYYEKELKSRTVVLNLAGEPVHPDTGRKSVRICCRSYSWRNVDQSAVGFRLSQGARLALVDASPPITRKRKTAFLLNLIFFCVYPLVLCCLSCTERKRAGPPVNLHGSKTNSVSDKDDNSDMICVNTYDGDGVDSKMEEEDTKYVIDELKKSRESLRRSGSKRDQSPTGESSSD